MALKQRSLYVLTAILVCALLATGTSVYMARANGASWTTVADTSWYNPIYPSYQIDSEEKLAGIAKLVNEDPTVDGFRGKRLEITKDLNLQNNGTHSNLIWEPIGTEAQPFRGSLTAYDGQTFSISGMTLPDNVPYAGLVGYMEAGTVGGLKFEATGSINVTNNNQPIYVGAAVGKMTGHSIVYNITNHIAISATSTQDVYAGGIVGSGEGDISTSINYGIVTAQGANTHAGGMTGHIGSYGMKMKKNANHAAITTTGNGTSDAYAAGIAGYAQGALRMEEENTPFDNSGAILVQAGGNNYAGGLVGRIDSELNVSELTSVTAQVEVNAPGSASSYVGGLVGAITAQQQDRSYRVNFLHTAPVVNNGGSQVYTGGIAGYVASDLTWHNAHTNTMTVTVSGTEQVYTGGLIGHITGELAFEAAAGNSAALLVTGEPDEAFTGGLVGYGGQRLLLNSDAAQAYANNGEITVHGGAGVYTGGIAGNRAYARTSGDPSNNVESNADLHVTGEQQLYTGGYIGWVQTAGADKLVSGAVFAASIDVASTGSADEQTVSTGGIVGYADEAHIESSAFHGELTATGGDEVYTGGIVGSLQSGTVTGSQAQGTTDAFASIVSDGTLGGIAGYADGTLEDVSSRHIALTATTPGAAAGGIAGSAQGTITGAIVGDETFGDSNSLTLRAEVTGGDGAHRLTAGGIVGHNETALSIVESSVVKTGFLTVDGTSEYTIGGIAGRLTSEASVGTAEQSVTVSNVTIDLQAEDSSFGGAVGANQAPQLYVDVRHLTVGSPADEVRAGGIVGLQEGAISGERSRMESRHVTMTLQGASVYAGGSFGQISGDSPATLADDIRITASGADSKLGGTAGGVTGTLTDSVASSVVITASGERTEAGGIAGRIESSGRDAAITRAHAVAGEQAMITATGAQSMLGGIVGHAVNASIVQPKADGELPNYVILQARAPQQQAGGVAGRIEGGGIVGDGFVTNLGNVLIQASDAATDVYVGGVAGYADGAKLDRLDGRTVNLTVSGVRTTVGGMAGYNKGTAQAVISNVALIGLNVQVNATASSSIVGGYVGLNDVRTGDPAADPATAVSSIQHSRVIGTQTRAVHVSAPDTITGGMVGENRTLIANNSITDKIPVLSRDSRGIIGGLVGVNTSTATLYYTYSNATLTIEGADTLAGGLVGNNAGVIQASYVDIDITSSAYGSQSGDVYLGGLVGRNTGQIKQSHTASLVTATGVHSIVGGLVGDHAAGSITDSYVVKNVRAQNEYSYSGGLAGRIGNGEIKRTYSTARVIAENGAYAGGFAGRYDNVSKELLYKNFYVKDEGKQFNNDLPDFAEGKYRFLGVLGGLSTLQTETLRDRQLFPGLSGWDFETTWKYASTNADYQYPELFRTANTGGQEGNNVNANINWYMNDKGAETYVLTTEAELAGLAALVNGTVPGMDAFDFRNRIIELGGKIAIQSQQWVPIGYDESHPFQGAFDGGHHLIDGLTIEPVHAYSGLFGVIGEHGAVRNITMEPRAVAGQNYTGVLAGFNKGTVSSVNLELLDGMTVSGKTVGSVIGKNTGTWSGLNITFEEGSRIVGAHPESVVGGVIGDNTAELLPQLFEIRSLDGSVGSDAEQSVIGGIVGRQTGDMSGFAVALKPEYRIFSGGARQTVGGLVGQYMSGQASELSVSFEGGVLAASGEGTIVGGVIGQSYEDNTLSQIKVEATAEGTHMSGQGVLGGAIGVKEGKGEAAFDLTDVTVTGVHIASLTDSTHAVIGGIVGQTTDTAVSGSDAEVTISGEAERVTVGGIVGAAHNSIFYNAQALPEMTVTARSGNSAVGGIAGVVSSDQRDREFDFGHWAPLYNGLYDARVLPTTIRVTGQANEANLAVGGLTGQLLDASITNSDSQASFLVQGGRTTELGGIAGYSSGIIVRAYAHGAIDVPSSRVFHIGGVVGHAVGGELHYTRWQGEADQALKIGTAVSKTGLLPATFVGGFVGSADRAVMANVSSDMKVRVEDGNQDNTIFAGGFAGMLGTGDPIQGTIDAAYATGDIQVSGRLGAYVGGFGGSINHYVITDSYASGDIVNTGFDTRSGGFAGAVEPGAAISDSYALQQSIRTTGTRGATRSYSGGFVGYNDGALERVHAGAVAIAVEVSGANVYSGSMIGYNFRDGKLEASTVDSTADVIGHNRGSAPSVTRQTVQPLGPTSIWTDRVDTDFLSDPDVGTIEIRTPGQLYGAVLLNNDQGLSYYQLFDRDAVAKLPLEHLFLSDNLDFTDLPAPMFDTFTGELDGRGHTISGLKLTDSGEAPVGFVRTLEGTIRDLRFASATLQASSIAGVVAGVNKGAIEQVQVDAQIESEGSHTGGLVGRNDGTIAKSLTTGRLVATAEGDSVAGGIAGENTASGELTDVLSYMDIAATSERVSAGGIVGRNSGDIAYAAFTGTVQADGIASAWAGGIAGYALDGTISQSMASASTIALSDGRLVPGRTYFGGIAGQQSANAELTGNVYNKQLLKLDSSTYDTDGTRVAGNNANQGLTGKQLTGSSLPTALNGAHWQATASLYPRLRELQGEPEALLGAAAVILHEQDLISRIERERTVSLSSPGIAWSAKRAEAIVNGAKATLVTTTQPIELTAAAGDLERTIRIQTVAPKYATQAVKPNVPAQTTITNTAQVELTTSEPGGRIYYTIDGRTPNETSQLYTAPFTLNQTTTVKAITIAENKEYSEVATGVWTKQSTGDGNVGGGGGGGGVAIPTTPAQPKPEPEPEPEATPAIKASIGSQSTSGSGSEPVTVAKNSKLALTAPAGQTIYYTTDGSKPTTRSKVYRGELIISGNMTVKAITSGDNTVMTYSFKVENAAYDVRKDADEVRYIAPYADQSFKPNQAITRFELIEALAPLLDMQQVSVGQPFSDVKSREEDLVGFFASAGIIEGYPNGTFGSDRGLTRAEFVVVLSRVLHLETDAAVQSSLSDVRGHWAESYVGAFTDRGLIQGFPDGTFRPQELVTRAQAVTVINRMVGTRLDAGHTPLTDVKPGHWAYDAIMSAIKQ